MRLKLYFTCGLVYNARFTNYEQNRNYLQEFWLHPRLRNRFRTQGSGAGFNTVFQKTYL